MFEVRHVLGVSERRACSVIGQHGSTQPKAPKRSKRRCLLASEVEAFTAG